MLLFITHAGQQSLAYKTSANPFSNSSLAA
jgi:hypothetical protein